MAISFTSSATISTLSLCSLSIPVPRSRPTSVSSLSSFSSSKSAFFNATDLLAHQQNKQFKQGLVLGRPTTRKGLSCNCLFGLGVPELVVIAGVAALVFGPKKLPDVGRSIGKTVKSFQQAAKEFETELKKEPEPAAEVPGEKPTAVGEGEKQDVVSPSAKES